MFLCPFPKVVGFDSPNDLQYGLAEGKAGESTVKNFLEIVNLRFTIFTIYDFYECHSLTSVVIHMTKCKGPQYD